MKEYSGMRWINDDTNLDYNDLDDHKLRDHDGSLEVKG